MVLVRLLAREGSFPTPSSSGKKTRNSLSLKGSYERPDTIFFFFSDDSVIQRITAMSECLGKEKRKKKKEQELVRETLPSVAIFASKFSRPLFLMVSPLI